MPGHPPALCALCRWSTRIALVLVALLPLVVQAQYPPVVTRSRIDPSRGVNFHAILLPDTVYVGQQATYQIGVFLNQEVRQRLRRNPEFVPPETRSLLVYDLPDAKAPLAGTIDGRPYEVHIFQRAFFALSPGRYEVPPSKLSYSLPQSASFFSREDNHALRSETLSLVVLPVPMGGRPADWAGAVGVWRARLRVDSASGRVGDPLVVTMRLEGQGNVTLLPRPKLVVDWGTVVPSDERVEFDSTPAVLRGAKEFDWLVTPRAEGVQSIPAQRFSFFDPAARRFEVAETSPIALRISEGVALAADSTQAVLPTPVPVSEAPTFGIRATLGESVRDSWLRTPWFLALMLLAPLPALAGVITRRPRRARPPRSTAQQLADAGREDDSDVASVRQLVHRTLRERLGLDAGLALAQGTLVDALRHEGVTVDTARRAETLLRLLDAAVFGARAASDVPTARELATLCTAIGNEARRGGAPRRSSRIARVIVLLGALLPLSASPSRAQQRDDAARSWADAQTAFAGRDYAIAERRFLDAARLNPRAPNAWANLGTAAWAAADTAHAVQGWQRALRLAPLDQELRDRLAVVRAAQDRGPARVPAVPVQLAGTVLLLAWLAGWAALARRAWRRRPVALRAAWLTVACAVILTGAAWLDDIQRAKNVVVILRAEPLRTLPVLGADLGPAPLTGEVARVLQRQGAWTHVQLDGAREGWIATELLLPLGGD